MSLEKPVIIAPVQTPQTGQPAPSELEVIGKNTIGENGGLAKISETEKAGIEPVQRKKEKEEDRTFNQALYHLVSHWAVFGAIFVLQLSLGTYISVSKDIMSYWYPCFVTMVGWFASIFILFRMNSFGNEVNFLAGTDTEKTFWFAGNKTRLGKLLAAIFRHPRNLYVFGLASTVITGLNLFLIISRWLGIDLDHHLFLIISGWLNKG